MKRLVKGEVLIDFESKGAGTLTSDSMNLFKLEHQSFHKPFVEHFHVQR